MSISHLASRISHLAIWLCVGAVACACAPENSTEQLSRVGETLGDFGCSGLVGTSQQLLRYSGVAITHAVCVPDGGGNPLVVSTVGHEKKIIDLEEVLAAERAAFRGWHASIEPELRAAGSLAPDQALDAYVWFHPGGGLADKETVLSESAASDAAQTALEASLRAAAVAISEKLSTTAGIEQIADVLEPEQYGIPVVRIRAKLTDLEGVGMWPEVWRIDSVPVEHKLAADDYYYTTQESFPDYFGVDGSGVTIAIYEGDYPDSWVNLPGAPSGSCNSAGTLRKCHCPTGYQGAHSRLVMGVVRRNSGIFGMANAATTISANYGYCQTYGPDVYSSALNWATSNGANIINHSACTGTGNGANSHDRFFDYKAMTWPFPLVVAAAGNDANANVCNKLRNGLVVGGGVELGGTDRAAVVSDQQKSYLNGAQAELGYELPHLTAISEQVTSAGYFQDFTAVTGGTSMAAPQVAGIAASMIELNPALSGWPEAMIPGLMVSADEDTDGVVLSLHDGIDDRDGAGLANAAQAWGVLVGTSKVNGGNSPTRAAHAYGSISSSVTPSGTFYYQQFNARVPAGEELRVAALLQARPTCPPNPGTDQQPCSADPYPMFSLIVYDGQTPVGLSANPNNNYQYISRVNNSGVQRDYTVKIYLQDWNGLGSTTWGLAWSSW